MFPVGAIVGGLLAARRAQAPTKARVIGSKYVAQVGKGVEHQAAALVWLLASPTLLFSLLPGRKASEMFVSGLVILALILPITPLFLGAYGKFFLFDHEGIEAVTPWRKRRRISYRDIVRIRRRFLGEGFVLRAANGVVLRVPDAFSGGITLAYLILQHLPTTAAVSASARRKLTAWAADEVS